MTDLDERLRVYAAERAEAISQHDADLSVTRTLARHSGRPSWTRHGLNAIAAVVLSLVLLAGGVVLGMQLHGLRTGSHAPSPGPLPMVPNEIVNLDNLSQGLNLLTPLRLADRKVLPPRPRWILEPGTGLTVDSTGVCERTTIRIVDLGSPEKDVHPPVSLSGCYEAPTLVPNSSVILFDHQVRSNDRTQDLGTVAYDWKAGKIVRSYPGISIGIRSGLVSADGKRLYVLNPDGTGAAQLLIVDLVTGSQIVDRSIDVAQVGLNSGGIALSPDGRTLYVNEGIGLQAFDAGTGQALGSVQFKDPETSPTALLSGWLSSWLPSAIDAEAKESLEPGHGIAVDPKGRWVAALGIDDPTFEGIWIYDTTSSMRFVRHISNPSRSSQSGFRGLASSLDGSVLYALYVEAQQGSVEVIDPRSGRMRAFPNSRFSDLSGIASVDPGP